MLLYNFVNSNILFFSDLTWLKNPSFPLTKHDTENVDKQQKEKNESDKESTKKHSSTHKKKKKSKKKELKRSVA